MSKSKIEWTDRVWNPVTGCTKISEGCENCYAERQSKRMEKMCPEKYKDGFDKVVCHPDVLKQPLKWEKPCKIFVCSMSDLFHEDVPKDFIMKVLSVAEKCPHHTFMILTKRPQRALELFHNWGLIPDDFLGTTPSGEQLPKNIWFGVTAENQQRADERIPILLQIPAVVRFVSIEPMLGPVDLGLNKATCNCCERWPSRWVVLKSEVQADFPFLVKPGECSRVSSGIYRAESNKHGALNVNGIGIMPDEMKALPGLDWVICGGESGLNARPVHVKWIESLRDQCAAAEVPFFFKQWGEWIPQTQKPDFIPGNKVMDAINIRLDGSKYVSGIATSGELCCVLKVGKKKAGSLLDGKEYKEWPEVES